MALHTLRAMACGGMYDQIGGGFARYSVDARWVIPHFEKMLYDNALLARAYLHGCQVSGEPFFERVCTETLDWALRDLRQEEGGFASALDADSEGEEGRFYVWTPDEVRAALGDDALAGRPGATSGSTGPPNFEGRWAPVRATSDPEGLGEIKARLRAARERRVWPALDDKRLTAWNALMISALADAGGGARARGLPRGRGRLRGVRLARHARRRRPPAAQLQPRPGAARRLPGGPRVPARGAADALRGDVRPALVRRRARAGRHDPRPLRRPRARRLLRHRRRPRGADRPAQGARGHADPRRRLGGRVRAAAAGAR